MLGARIGARSRKMYLARCSLHDASCKTDPARRIFQQYELPATSRPSLRCPHAPLSLAQKEMKHRRDFLSTMTADSAVRSAADNFLSFSGCQLLSIRQRVQWNPSPNRTIPWCLGRTGIPTAPTSPTQDGSAPPLVPSRHCCAVHRAPPLLDLGQTHLGSSASAAAHRLHPQRQSADRS